MKKVRFTISGLSEHLEGWLSHTVDVEVDDETFKRLFTDKKNAEVEIFAFPAGDDVGSLFGRCDLQYEDTAP